MSILIPTVDAIDALAQEFARLDPSDQPSTMLKHALSHGTEVAISFSGAEDVVLIAMAHSLRLPFRVFSLDTGRLHAETYQFLETVRKHFGITN